MNRFLLVALGGILLLSFDRVSAQAVQQIHLPQYNAPYLILVAQAPLLSELEQKIKAHANREQSAYVLINGTALSPNQIKDTLNDLLNSDLHIAKNQVHFVVVGDSAFFQRHNRFTDDFFASHYFLCTEPLEDSPSNFPQASYATTTWSAIVETLLPQRHYKIRIDQIKDSHGRFVYRRKGLWGFGIGTNRDWLFLQKNEAEIPQSVGTFSLNLRRQIASRWQLRTSFGIGINIPNPQKIIQEQIRSQIDLVEIASGNSTAQDIELNIEMEGHIYRNLQLETQYFLRHNPRFRPYLSAGISFANLTSISGQIDTLFTFDPNDIDLNAGFGDFENGLDDDRISNNNFGVLQIPLALGFQKQLSRAWLLDVYTQFAWNPSQDQNQFSLHRLSLGIGLSYSLVGKRKRYYDYVRLR